MALLRVFKQYRYVYYAKLWNNVSENGNAESDITFEDFKVGDYLSNTISLVVHCYALRIYNLPLTWEIGD